MVNHVKEEEQMSRTWLQLNSLKTKKKREERGLRAFPLFRLWVGLIEERVCFGRVKYWTSPTIDFLTTIK